jgi:parallel beta-helix repeat protein
VALEGCNVIDNTATHNDWYGIYLYGDGNMAKRNTLRNNTESNIYVDGMYNAIEENLVTGAKVGIDFAQDDNYYANNRALGNTINYQNTVGQTDGGGNVSIF